MTSAIRGFISSAAVLVITCAAGAASLDKIVAFPTADQVVVHASFSADPAIKDVKLTGEIVPIPEGPAIWTGEIGTADVAGTATSQYTIKGLKPKLWTPLTPTLYQLKISATHEGKEIGSKIIRVGFRSFEARDGHVFLNEKPIFLRGIAINPPARTIPPTVGESRQFAHDYVKFLRSQNVNIIRLEHDSDIWFDVCDELGMMLYQGVYGSPPARIGEKFGGKEVPPTDVESSVKAYKRIFEKYANHPSIIIYILSNELPYNGERGDAWSKFLTQVHAQLKPWDPSRPFIGNAGYGQGREGDINDIHRYWGWYYNSFLTYYNLRDVKLFGDYEKNQPLTFTECVGNFTAPTGEYNLIEKKQLGAALGWCGWAEKQADIANEHQCRVLKHAAESFRRMRSLNPRLSGLMPFTILFDNWQGIKSFSDMHPKPAMAQMATSYQPVLPSWELWTSQVYAGAKIHPVAHVINDAEDFSDLMDAKFIYAITDAAGKGILGKAISLPTVPYYGTWSQRLEVELPKDMPTGMYSLKGTVRSSQREISSNSEAFYIAGSAANKEPAPQPKAQIALYDPVGSTATALKRLKIPFKKDVELSELDPKSTALVIGESAWGGPLHTNPEHITSFMQKGGRILCLAQDPEKLRKDWLPAQIEFFTASANESTYPPAHRPTRDQSNLNPQRPGHPIFDGIPRERLEYWSDYTDWDQTKENFPRIYPVTRGFRLIGDTALSHTAILIDYDRGLEGIALAEFFDGPGSVLLSGLDLVARCGLDPIADRMLRNLVLYTANQQPHEIHPKVTQPIKWGNYPTQQGVLAGPIQGLLIDVEWTPPKLDPNATPLTRAQGAWNTRPSDQFIPHGVRMFGPYTYSTGTAPRDLNRTSTMGSGFFWASLPAGRKVVTTKVQNPLKTDVSITVDTGVQPRAATSVPAGKTITITSPLPADASNVRVQYTGDKELVILETAFE
jgi:beta-galactosidase